MFKENQGNIDRLSRIIIGVGLLSLLFVGPHSWWGLIGAVPLLTGLVGYCPMYRVLGISTCPRPGAT